ncbi:YheC/YheD family endospore coat-associated protein [Falsibacillus albus]|uniref:YheC/YheD family protein n=1 Tax=Falsibacillus albus TaxID=2478915 RepID=A0A3L7K2M2_9BACI|nr:YheC/YheD family protein [Falsibacillus albus]RLQ97316.1 YheC/YheD family protein [Falsibacillus albus]
MAKQLKIETFDSREHIIYVPGQITSPDEIKRVGFGSSTQSIDCKPQPNGRNIITISSALAKELNLPSYIQSIHIFAKEDCLHLGPLVGIFSSGFTPFQIRPIGERSFLFAKLLSSHASSGVVPFLFGEQHIDWGQGVIEGFFFTNKGWESLKVPFPNVVYDRLPNRRSEKLKASQAVKERFEKDYLIPWYNPGFFNKLEVFEKLYNVGEAEPFLPETSPFQSFHQIEKMLADYGHVFIKPQNGSLGLGVHQLIYDKKNHAYYCRYRDGENRLQKFSTLEALMKKVFANRSLERMLVQQGIYLIRHEQRPIDFRVHVNKDEHGEWKLSAIAAKIAGTGSPTTHINNGGTVKTLEEIFPDKTAQQKYKDKLEQAALLLAQALEKQVGGIIAEIGFDFGLDRQDRVWLFEANSKPGRSIFSHPLLKEFDMLTRKLALSYAVFLTEQTIDKPEELFR